MKSILCADNKVQSAHLAVFIGMKSAAVNIAVNVAMSRYLPVMVNTIRAAAGPVSMKR
jgi:hypothetical protein